MPTVALWEPPTVVTREWARRAGAREVVTAVLAADRGVWLGPACIHLRANRVLGVDRPVAMMDVRVALDALVAGGSVLRDDGSHFPRWTLAS